MIIIVVVCLFFKIEIKLFDLKMSWRISLSSFYIQAVKKRLNNRDCFGDHHKRKCNLDDLGQLFL